MSDINHMISLGIGSPASIGFFMRFGLSFQSVGVIGLSLADRDLTGTLSSRSFAGGLPGRDLAPTLDKRDAAALVLPDRSIATETETRP